MLQAGVGQLQALGVQVLVLHVELVLLQVPLSPHLLLLLELLEELPDRVVLGDGQLHLVLLTLTLLLLLLHVADLTENDLRRRRETKRR